LVAPSGAFGVIRQAYSQRLRDVFVRRDLPVDESEKHLAVRHHGHVLSECILP
jgi:hypothetical protein